MALLRFDGLSFAYPYDTRRTLQNVSFEMAEGEYLVLCGPSGCGKTTLLKQAKRELRPAGSREGQVLYQNTPVDMLDAEMAFTEIGYVQQNPEDQIVTDFVWHELAFGLENLALPTKVIRRRVAEMAAFFGMEPWFRKKTSELSGGQKQMLNLASVMAMNPKLLILDEPTSMLDPLAARSLLDTVERINRELGVAVLLTEHRLDAVFPVCDRVLVMDGGKLRIDGAPAKIAAQLAQETEKERLYYGLPAPVRICGELGADPIPLSVRQARGYLKTILKDAKPQAEEPAKQESEREDKPVLSCKEVWMRYASTEPDVLRGAELQLYKKEHLCLLGGNGAGKTTLLSCLIGTAKPQRGKVGLQKNCRLAMLPQRPQALFTQDDVLSDLLEVGNEADARAWAEKLELTGLLDRHPFDLSGGELQRAALCKLLLRNADVLLLDEPTNHLDLDSIRWLEEFLIDFENTIIVVSHDRYFLNKVCTHTVDLDYGKMQIYAGNYDFWYESSQLMIKQMKEANKKKEEKIKELQEFIQRFSANASKSKQATSRKRALEKIELDTLRPSSRKYPYVDFKPDREIGNEVLTVTNLSKTIDGEKVLDNVSFTVGHDDKIAFVGSYGIAATTLFQILAGEMEPDEGDYKWGITTSNSYFPKDNTAYFDSNDTIVDWLMPFSPEKDATYVRGFLGRMLFKGDDGLKKVNVLSGGEKVRVMLSKMMMLGSNVLLMDEPTNHLDMESITSVNNGLIKFPGVVLFTSQDHQFIQTIANRIIEFTPNGMIDKVTTYDEYLDSDEMARKRQALS